MCVSDDGRLLVDGLNVLGSRPDGWWRDREAAFGRLIAELQPLAARRSGPVIVVVEGRAGAAIPPGRHGDVEVVHAQRRGRDAADDRIVSMVATPPRSTTHGRPHDTVVTADRALIDRVRELGAEVLGPATLLRQLDVPD